MKRCLRSLAALCVVGGAAIASVATSGNDELCTSFVDAEESPPVPLVPGETWAGLVRLTADRDDVWGDHATVGSMVLDATASFRALYTHEPTARVSVRIESVDAGEDLGVSEAYEMQLPTGGEERSIRVFAGCRAADSVSCDDLYRVVLTRVDAAEDVELTVRMVPRFFVTHPQWACASNEREEPAIVVAWEDAE